MVAEILAGDDMINAVRSVWESAQDSPDITSKAFQDHRLEIYAKLADKIINTIARHQMKDRWEHDD